MKGLLDGDVTAVHEVNYKADSSTIVIVTNCKESCYYNDIYNYGHCHICCSVPALVKAKGVEEITKDVANICFMSVFGTLALFNIFTDMQIL